jgi:glutamyl-tRNA synthetase
VQVALEGVVAAREAKPKQVFQPIRVALAGRAISPGIFETVAVLGRDETLRRLESALRP